MDLFCNGDQSPNFSEPWNFSDTVLVVEDKRFHVHKSILAISSLVFNTMFQSGFKEAVSTEIPLPGKKAEKIYELLCMIYPFPVQISGEAFVLEAIQGNNQLLLFNIHMYVPYKYSCFEKGCPAKPYTAMSNSIITIMGNGGSWSLIEALLVSAT